MGKMETKSRAERSAVQCSAVKYRSKWEAKRAKRFSRIEWRQWMCGRDEWYESSGVTSDSEVTNTLFSDLL